MCLKYSRLGFRWDSDRGFRVTHPVRILLPTFVLTLLSLGGLYVVVGCESDWPVLIGLLLDICGALGLGVLGFPRLGKRCYARRLQDFHDELLGEGAPPLTPRREAFLLDVFTDLPSNPKFSIENEQLLIESQEDPTDRGDNYSLEIVQRRLQNHASDESDRLLQVAVSLLIGGFVLQFLGQLIDSRTLLRLLDLLFQFIGLPIGSC